jgi:hypothetical protein
MFRVMVVKVHIDHAKRRARFHRKEARCNGEDAVRAAMWKIAEAGECCQSPAEA